MTTAMSSTLARTGWEALGTSVVLLVDDPGALGTARAIVERKLRAIDRACSRFRPDSDLQRANAEAGRFVSVSPLLIQAVEVALRAAVLTDGDVDPTVGNALVLAGYDRDWTLLEGRSTVDGLQRESPPEPELELEPGPEIEPEPEIEVKDVERPVIKARITPGWRAIELDCERSAIRIPTGVRLDLGATAKAWVADRAAAAVHEATGAGTLVALGGDIATAGAAPEEEGWRVYVTDDHRRVPGEQGQTISIRCGGIATSSTTARHWHHEGRTQHHIIDPATGVPLLPSWRTVSVAAETCLDANIASTAALIRADAAPRWLGQVGLPARLVSEDGTVCLVGDWPAEGGAVRLVGEWPVAGETR
jgi:FAD:protein FMN transferase